MPDQRLDPFRDIMGVDFDAERLRETIEAFAPVLDEIRKLRSLDLSDVQPAVVFDPTQGYDK